MLPKTSAYVKNYDIQTKWMYFLIKDDDLLKKYKNIWDKLSADLRKKNLTANLLIIKIKSQKKKKKNVVEMKLQISRIKKFLRWTLMFSSNRLVFSTQER